MLFKDALDADYRNLITGEFSEQVTLTVGDNSQTVNGLFEASYEFIDPETRARVLSEDSRLTLYESMLIVDPRSKDATITARSTDYNPYTWHSDGEGALILFLNRVEREDA